MDLRSLRDVRVPGFFFFFFLLPAATRYVAVLVYWLRITTGLPPLITFCHCCRLIPPDVFLPLPLLPVPHSVPVGYALGLPLRYVCLQLPVALLRCTLRCLPRFDFAACVWLVDYVVAVTFCWTLLFDLLDTFITRSTTRCLPLRCSTVCTLLLLFWLVVDTVSTWTLPLRCSDFVWLPLRSACTCSPACTHTAVVRSCSYSYLLFYYVDLLHCSCYIPLIRFHYIPLLLFCCSLPLPLLPVPLLLLYGI